MAAGGPFCLGDPVSKKPSAKKSRAEYRDELVRKAYERVSTRLEGLDPEVSKAIDDLVKLLKADKDLGMDETTTGEIELQWVPSEEKKEDK